MCICDIVKVYDNVKGVSTNLFFISHVCEEHRDEELKSMSNEHEATYLVALCNYLVLQGYAPSQITILTPYTGQVIYTVTHKINQSFICSEITVAVADSVLEPVSRLLTSNT